MRNKKSVLSALLAAVLLVACVAGMLITGVSAEEPTHKVLVVDGVGASGSGKYKTVTNALRSISSSQWAPGSTVTIEVEAEATSGESLTKMASSSDMFNVFGVNTLFVSDGTKLPITIRGTYVAEGETEGRSSLRFLNWGYANFEYVFANDYTFENLDLYFSKYVQTGWNSDGSRKLGNKNDYLFAGCGEIEFKNVRFCRTNYQYVAADKSDSSTKQEWTGYTENSRATTFYGDIPAEALGPKKSGSTEHMDGIFSNWDAEKFAANLGEDGLLKTGFTFDDVTYFTSGSAGGSPSSQAWQRAYVAASYGDNFSYTIGDITVENENIHAYINVTGDTVMTRLSGFRSNAVIEGPAKVSLNINGNATVYGVFADSGNGGSYHDSNWDAYVSNTRKVNVEINISENALIKGNNGSSADSCSISGVSDATYTEDSRVVININGGTIEQEIVAVGGHNIATGKAGDKFYNLPLDTAGEFEINIRGGEFKDAIYGIFSKNIYNCNTLRGTVDINLYVPVEKSVYGVYSDSTDNPNYKGTIDPSEKGKGSVIADDAKVSVNVLGGTHTADIYGIAGSAGAVEAGGEVAICLNGGTVNGTFRIGLGTEYSIESGATAACYLTQGTIPAAAVVASTGSETTAVDTFDEGSKLYVEVGDLTYATPATAVYPAFVKTSYIKGDVEFVIKGNCVLPATNSKNTFRPLYDVYVGGDFTFKIIPEAGKKFVSECEFQSVYSSYIKGDSSVLVDGGEDKNVQFKKAFFGATGYNTVQTLKNGKFDGGIFSDRSGSSGRSYRATAAEGANNVTWNLDNVTAKYFYPSQYDTAGGGMKIYGKLINNVENSKITSTVHMGSYRSYYNSGTSVTQTTPFINELENNFKGGNTFSGTVYCGGRTASKVEPDYGSINSIVNNITGKNSFNVFYGGSNSSSSYHSESIGSIQTTIAEGSTFNTFYAGSKYAWYKEGVQGTVTTIINGGTFKNAVYAGNQDGAAAATQTLTINAGTFSRVYGDGVEMAENADVIIVPQISMILNERIEMKALLDKRLVDLYCQRVGTPSLIFKLDGKDLGEGFASLAAEGDLYALILPAAGAGDFDLALDYEFNGNLAVSTTIQELAEKGVTLYAGTADEAIFKALVDYGSAANGATELKYFDAAKLEAATLPEAAAPEAGAGNVKISAVTLLMGDAIGIRFKSESDLAGITIKVNGERIGSGFYSTKEGAIDLYINAENLNEILNVEVLDANGTLCATFGYAVSNIAADIYKEDATNLKAAAVLELILAVEAAKTVA